MASPEDKDRVNLVLRSPQLLRWLMEPTSAALLINGHSDNTSFVSPMSHFCAFLAESLKKERTPTCMFFCGLRCSKNTAAGAQDLVKSLIAQLMLRFEFDFSFLKDKKPKKLQEPKKLCWILQEMVGMLPEGTQVFWIVDDVSLLECASRADVTSSVFVELLRIIREVKSAAVKLLVTSENRSYGVASLWGGGSVLDIPADVDGERQGTVVPLNGVGGAVPHIHG